LPAQVVAKNRFHLHLAEKARPRLRIRRPPRLGPRRAAAAVRAVRSPHELPVRVRLFQAAQPRPLSTTPKLTPPRFPGQGRRTDRADRFGAEFLPPPGSPGPGGTISVGRKAAHFCRFPRRTSAQLIDKLLGQSPPTYSRHMGEAFRPSCSGRRTQGAKSEWRKYLEAVVPRTSLGSIDP